MALCRTVTTTTTQGDLTPEDLAAHRGVHVETVRRRLRRGEIAGVRWGRNWRIPAPEAARVLGTPVASCETAAPPPLPVPELERLPRLLTLTEAAVWLRCGEREVRKLVRKGSLPSIGGGWRIPLDAVLQNLRR